MTKRTERGFTMIELLIAIAVVGILVPTMIGFINTLNRLNDRAQDLTLINSLAENKVESLRSLGFTGLENGTVDFSNELPATIGSPRNASYTVTTPSVSLRKVDVTFSYNDHGQQKTLTYHTIIGEVGVGQY